MTYRDEVPKSRPKWSDFCCGLSNVVCVYEPGGGRGGGVGVLCAAALRSVDRCGDIIVWQQASPLPPPEVAGEAAKPHQMPPFLAHFGPASTAL